MSVYNQLDKVYPPLIGRAMRLTDNGYLEYATGITAIATPEAVFEDRTSQVATGEIWLAHSERLAVNGLRKLIAVANYPIVDSLQLLETYFDKTCQRLLAARDHDLIVQADALAGLHPDIPEIKPLPIAERAVFHAIAAGEASQLTVEQLLGGISVDIDLVPDLINRRLSVD